MTEQSHILVADDDELIRDALGDLLRQEGYACDCVADGTSALTRLQEQTYELIIADIKMPGNPELELIHAIAQLTPVTFAILITGYPSLHSAIKSIQLPVAAYLTKPVSFEELLRQAKIAIHRTHMARTIQNAYQTVDTIAQDLGQTDRPAWAPVMDIPITITKDKSPLPTSTSPTSAEESPTSSELSDIAQTAQQILKDLREARGETALLLSETRLDSVKEQYHLTARELETLRRLLSNQRVTVIARELGLSPHTVRNHLKALFRKTQTGSQAELIARFGSRPG